MLSFSIYCFICICVVETKIPEDNNYTIVYEYNEKEVKDFTTTYFTKTYFEIATDNCKFKVYPSNNYREIIIENMTTNHKVNISAINAGFLSSLNAEVIENEDNFIILYYDYVATQNQSVTTLHYLRIPKKSVSNDNEFLDNLGDSIKTFDIPKADNIGYLTIDDSEYKYPLVNTTTYDKFIIDENDELFVISMPNE